MEKKTEENVKMLEFSSATWFLIRKTTRRKIYYLKFQLGPISLYTWDLAPSLNKRKLQDT